MINRATKHVDIIICLLLLQSSIAVCDIPVNGYVTERCPIIREALVNLVHSGELGTRYREPLLACLNPGMQRDADILTALVAYVVGEIPNPDDALWTAVSESAKGRSRPLSDAFYQIASIKRQARDTGDRIARLRSCVPSDNIYLEIEAAKAIQTEDRPVALTILRALWTKTNPKSGDRSVGGRSGNDSAMDAAALDIHYQASLARGEIARCLMDLGDKTADNSTAVSFASPYSFVTWVIRGEPAIPIHGRVPPEQLELLGNLWTRVRETGRLTEEEEKQVIRWLHNGPPLCRAVALVLYPAARGDTPKVRQTLRENATWACNHPESLEGALMELGFIRSRLRGKTADAQLQDLSSLLTTRNAFLRIEVVKLIHALDSERGKALLRECAASREALDDVFILQGEAGRMLWNMGETLEPGVAFRHMFLNEYLDYLAIVEGAPLWKWVGSHEKEVSAVSPEAKPNAAVSSVPTPKDK